MGLLNPQKPFFLEIVLVTDTEAFKTYDVTNHLKKFEYSVVSEDGGGLTYTIDVINPLGAVEELVKEYHNNFYSDVVTDKPISWLPKILIQWGYGKEKKDGISKVHLATLTDLKYTFSSGKEKLLSITAVGDTSFTNQYTKGLLKAQWRGKTIRTIRGRRPGWQKLKPRPGDSAHSTPVDKLLRYEGDNLRFTEVIEKLLAQHFSHFLKTDVRLKDIDWNSIEDKLRGMYNSYVTANAFVDDPDEPATQQWPQRRAAKEVASKDATFKIFEYFGFDVQLVSISDDFKDTYKVTYSKMGPGGTGKTEYRYFHKDQLQPGASDMVGKLKAARDAKVGGQPLNHGAQKSDINFPEDLDFDPDAAGLTYTVISTPDEITTQSGFFTGTKSHVRIRSSNGHEFGASLGTAGSSELRTSKLKRDKLAIQEDTKYQKLVTDAAGLDRTWVASAPERVNYEDLSDDEKSELNTYAQFLQVSWISPEGTPLKKTIFDFLEKINSLLDDPEQHFIFYTQSPALFDERGTKTLKEVYKTHIENKEKSTIITVTQRKFAGENDYKDKDMEIFSYPQLNYPGEPFRNTLLTYGGNDSTVKFFDFTSDLAYLTQSIQGIKSFLSMNNNAEFLTYDRITESLFYFVKELSKSDTIIEDKDKRERIRSSISMQEGNNRKAVEINEETLGFLKDLGSTIDSKEVRGVLKRSKDPKKERAFRSFVTMLQDRASLSSFLELQGGKHSATYDVVFGSTSETFSTSTDIAYTLKKDNLFDQFIKDKGINADKVLKVYASDYLRGYPTQVRIKTLGVPELDTIMDVNSVRSIVFDVHDLSRERVTGVRNIHWLSGTYTPYEIKHIASPSEGYLTEISLLRNSLGTSKREDNNE